MSRPVFRIKKAQIAGLFCLAGLVLAGCDRPAVLGEHHAAPEDLPAYAPSENLKVVDLDANGVSDVVDALLVNNVESSEARKSWLVYAKTIQQASMLDPLSESPYVVASYQNYTNALACIRLVKIDDELRSSLMLRIYLLTLDSSSAKGNWHTFQSISVFKGLKPKAEPCADAG